MQIFILYNTVRIKKDVISICKSYCYQITSTSLIRKHVNDEMYKTLVRALATSRLWHCVVIRCPVSPTNRLKRVQIGAARLVTGSRKRDRITPILFQFFWLPMQYRSVYKILCCTHKVLNGTASVCVSDLAQKYKPVRLLQADTDNNIREEILCVCACVCVYCVFVCACVRV